MICVIATGGEAGELNGSDDLAVARARRIAKYEHALSVLGAASWTWLEPGAEWVDAPGGPRVAAADAPRLRSAIERLLSEHAPQVVLTVGSDGLTGHPDHIAVGSAVADAVRHARLEGGAWGARLDPADVASGARLVAGLAPDRTDGARRVIGARAELVGYDVSECATARRAALDAYLPGLGTASLRELIDSVDRIGDSLLLRAVFDAEGWRTERYQRLDAEG